MDVAFRLCVRVLCQCPVHLLLAGTVLRGRAYRTGDEVGVQHLDVRRGILSRLRVPKVLLAAGYNQVRSGLLTHQLRIHVGLDVPGLAAELSVVSRARGTATAFFVDDRRLLELANLLVEILTTNALIHGWIAGFHL